jgi:YihY family inner membrane protein
VGFVFADDPQAQREVVDAVSTAVPGLGEALGETIDVAIRTRGATGLIGLVGVLFAGLRVIDGATLAVSRVFRVDATDESGVVRKARATGNLVLLGTLAILATSAGALAGVIVLLAETLGLPEGLVRLRGLLAFVMSFALDVVLFSIAYRVLTAARGPRFPDLWPGAVLAAIGWTALKVFGATYVGNTAEQWDAVYGALGVVIGTMLLLFLAGRIFLYGAELNALRLQREGRLTAPGADVATSDAAVGPERADTGAETGRAPVTLDRPVTEPVGAAAHGPSPLRTGLLVGLTAAIAALIARQLPSRDEPLL